MLSRTRVSGSIDAARLAALVSRPGIDPRIWASIGIVTAVLVETEGVFADVTLVPSQLETTARVASIYAGPGFGLYVPVEIDDEVQVTCPSGDPAEGLVILPRLWSRSDSVPPAAVAHQADLVLVVRDGRNLRIDVSGGGTVQFNGDSDALALASKVRANLDRLQQSFDAHTHPFVAQAGPNALITAVTATPVGALPGTGSTIVKAGA